MSEKLSQRSGYPSVQCHVPNQIPHMLKKLIRTKFQVINNCRERMEGLVST